MLRFAMIGKWHVHAEGYAQFVKEQPDAAISCVWDDDAARGRAWAGELGVEFVERYEDVLAREDVDAVLVCTPTSAHRDVMVRAARAKKHIFTEKVMALTVPDCDEIARAVEENGVIFTISFPQRCEARNLFIKRAIDSGELGEITVLRVRNCHNGSLANWLPEYWYDPQTTGGGAMMDLGAHPMYLARWMLGRPVRIQSMFNSVTGRAVEDNAVSTIEFENGAIAISETSLVSPYTPALFEVYGTKGVILCSDRSMRMRTDGRDWFEPEYGDESLPHPIRQFIDSALHGKSVLFGAREGLQLTELMEGAYTAHREKREVEFA